MELMNIFLQLSKEKLLKNGNKIESKKSLGIISNVYV